MCQILFSESKNPPKEAFKDGNAMNKDGFGFAYVEEKQVVWSKGFDHKDLDDKLIEQYCALPFPKAIHFRLATHGGTSQELTHPFPIKRGNSHDLKGKAPAVLFHNGIWHQYEDRLREAILAGTINPNVLKGGMSDSRAMAVLAQRFGHDILDVLNLGSNKVLILTGTTYSQYGSWTEKEGWSASSSKIFRELAERDIVRGKKASKGVVLGPSGLPLTPAEVAEHGRNGRLNRHGNLRERFRGGRVQEQQRPDLGPTSGKVDAEGNGVVRLNEVTERPTQSSLYLSATMEQIKDMTDCWGQRERMQN